MSNLAGKIALVTGAHRGIGAACALALAAEGAALILADRGQLDLDAPAGRYWQEFAAPGRGQDKVLVRHLLSHTAGLPDWTGPIAELYDWQAATARRRLGAAWAGVSRMRVAQPSRRRSRGADPGAAVTQRGDDLRLEVAVHGAVEVG